MTTPPLPDADVAGEAGPGLDRDVPPPDDGGARLALLRDDPPSPRRPRFRLETLDDLLQLPRVQWLLDAHLPEGGFAVLYGPPGAGKSFVALSWALSIARGCPWLQRPTRRGAVIYITSEGGGAIGQRAQAYRDAHELTGPLDILFVRETVNLLADADSAALLADVNGWIDAHGLPSCPIPEHPALFVFDTLARAMPGGDENSARDVGLVIAAADRIRQRTGAAVLMIHHTQKLGDLERGSSALRGAADAMFALKNEDGVRTLECSKMKESALVDPQQFRLVPVGASCVLEPLEGSAAPVGLTPTQRILLGTLADLLRAGDDSAAVSTWIRASKVSERSAFRAIGDLREHGLVVQVGKRYRLGAAGELALRHDPNHCQNPVAVTPLTAKGFGSD